ncbi:MAG: helix-turn-helix domain-containing protein [Actinomycetota bacterium]|nr:helix-turn-helix domain-containing protein [Actinomycetota bacterium]
MPGPYDPTQTCLGIPELATWLHITERHVRCFVAERRIPFHKIGGGVSFVPTEITAWLDNNWYEAQPARRGR